MLKFRISKDNYHYLDLSPHAGAVWMDKGEWDLLKHEGLIYKLNSIFSEAWQAKIREGKTKEALEENYIRQFGEETYVRLKEIRAWLYAQDSPHLLLAYLNVIDPYSTGK